MPPHEHSPQYGPDGAVVWQVAGLEGSQQTLKDDCGESRTSPISAFHVCVYESYLLCTLPRTCFYGNHR